MGKLKKCVEEAIKGGPGSGRRPKGVPSSRELRDKAWAKQESDQIEKHPERYQNLTEHGRKLVDEHRRQRAIEVENAHVPGHYKVKFNSGDTTLVDADANHEIITPANSLAHARQQGYEYAERHDLGSVVGVEHLPHVHSAHYPTISKLRKPGYEDD